MGPGSQRPTAGELNKSKKRLLQAREKREGNSIKAAVLHVNHKSIKQLRVNRKAFGECFFCVSACIGLEA